MRAEAGALGVPELLMSSVCQGLLLPISEPQFTSLLERLRLLSLQVWLQVSEAKVLSLEPLPPENMPLPQPPLPLWLCLWMLELSGGPCWTLFRKLRSLLGVETPKIHHPGKEGVTVTACGSEGVCLRSASLSPAALSLPSSQLPPSSQLASLLQGWQEPDSRPTGPEQAAVCRR